MKPAVITFIGAGNLTRALVAGLIANDYPPESIWVTNPSVDKLEALQTRFGVHVTQDNRVGAEQADVIVLSVKPRMTQQVATEIADIVATKKTLLISVAVGVTEAALLQWIDSSAMVVRAMPNVAAMVGASATGLYASDQVDARGKEIAECIFRAVGLTLWVDQEWQIDSVTAVSGSGPAYYFLLMEAMQQAAVSLGLPLESAQLLVSQTALGASRLALETGQEAATLRHSVTSKRGTTEEAIKVFEAGAFGELVAKAMQAACERAKELSDILDEQKR